VGSDYEMLYSQPCPSTMEVSTPEAAVSERL
jgi:hypothetical protein